MPYPAWYLDETVDPILPPLYTVGYESITGEYLGVLVIDGNKSGGTLNLSCKVERQTAYTTRLTIEGLWRFANVCYDNTQLFFYLLTEH